MTKNWLNTDADFNELVNRIETYSGYSKSMRHPPAQVSMIIWTLCKLIQKRICYTLSYYFIFLALQSFANDLHYHVAKGYISELLRNKYSCKGRKNDAAAKINEQWTELNMLFCEMVRQKLCVQMKKSFCIYSSLCKM